MNTLPERSNLEHLRSQAKDLLRLYRDKDSEALERLRNVLPAARGKSDETLIKLGLRLADMQSCIAREYGFASWPRLKDEVELRELRSKGLVSLREDWLKLVYGPDVAGGYLPADGRRAARLLTDRPDVLGDDPYLHCAIGDEDVLEQEIARDRAWCDRRGGPLNIPPLIALTHSALGRIDPFRERLLRCVRRLLDANANPNVSIGDRYPPHSVEHPGDGKLSALYGAAGKLHDAQMTQMLLAAGADPNDGESLYHSLEDSRRELPCTRLLLEAGARVTPANALCRVLDDDNLGGLQMLLEYTEHGDKELNRALLWAIYRGRSAQHVNALLGAGADPHSTTPEGESAYRYARRFGLSEAAELLAQRGAGATLSEVEEFVCACARADEAEARRQLLARPDLLDRLSETQRRQLPLMAMGGFDAAVKLMVRLGWEIGARGGDMDGSALNWAVFRGNPELARFLLEHGASWREPHGFGSDVIGTLSWASLNEPVDDGDWVQCAEALVAHGMPRAKDSPGAERTRWPRRVLIDGRRMAFSEDVIDVLVGADV